MDESKVNILIVDDRPDKLLALEAVLAELGENIVLARDGPEALRHVLNQEFAVILLDVNMPGMDGFETAQFIRQRRSSAAVPIIFLTAMTDEMHVARGYSLGAVDYILTPAVPEVLRSKVAVFVDLFKKTQRVQSQAERLRQRAMQLHRLTSASLAIHSAPSIEKIAQITADTAREVVGAHQAVMIVAPPQRLTHVTSHASYSEKYEKWAHVPPKLHEHDVHALVRETNKPMRMTQAELSSHHELLDLRTTESGPPLHGLLAMPLIGRDGRNMGLVFLSEKFEQDFTEDDQAILIQLVQMAAVAIENTLFAEERESNRAKDEFLSTLSHELRTPLSAIAGWVQLMKMEATEGKVARGLQVIERNVAAQLRLIEELLDLSRIEAGKLTLRKQNVSLKTVIESALDSVRPSIEAKGISLDCRLETDTAKVIGDPDRLQQVIWNLLSNAAKFTPNAGNIRVSLACENGNFLISVTDSGEGIDPDFLPHVFDRFRQADSTSSRRHGGLGIGLTIVRHIVELHGGTVAADSAGKNCGSTFSIKLPANSAEPENSDPHDESPAEPARSLRAIRVLLVEDEADAREAILLTLRQCEADVTAVGSVREALQLWPHLRPQVLVSDLAMPEQDGFALLKAIRAMPREDGGQTPAIALTAYTRSEDRAQTKAAGFQLHIAKPVDPAKLINAIYQCSRQPAISSMGVQLYAPDHAVRK